MKNGIPYFPLDCQLDDKFELIEAEFGLQGFSVVVKLLQKIYGGEGYYCEWTKEVALLFSKNLGLGVGVVSEIVSASVKRGIFSDTLFSKHEILSSKGIQKRYFEAVSRRKRVEVKKDYLLISADILPKNAYISEENVNISSKNADISKQRKEEERREENSKEDIRQVKLAMRTKSFIKPTTEQIKAYCQEHGYSIDEQYFYNYYESNGWMVGRNKMKDWQATVRNWHKRNKEDERLNGKPNTDSQNNENPFKKYGNYL